MSEFYGIIISKLEQDKKRCDEEIKNIIDEVDYDEVKKDRYNRLLGAKSYCSELIDFFYQASTYI